MKVIVIVASCALVWGLMYARSRGTTSDLVPPRVLKEVAVPAASVGVPERRRDAPSFSEKVTAFSALDTGEIDRRLAEAKERLRAGRWIERANEGTLPSEQFERLRILLREEGALHAVRAERFLDDLEGG